jgi:CRP-like cAMP-binding protein
MGLKIAADFPFAMRRLHLEKGETAYSVGDAGDEVFLVRSGQVEIVTEYPETGPGVDARHGPGHVFGEVETIDGRPRAATARAAKATDLVVFGREELMEILYQHPEKSLLLGKSSFNRLKELYSNETLDSELARLREEMELSIRDAVVAHESRVVKSHNGMLAIAAPIIVMVLLAVGAYWFFHRG